MMLALFTSIQINLCTSHCVRTSWQVLVRVSDVSFEVDRDMLSSNSKWARAKLKGVISVDARS